MRGFDSLPSICKLSTQLLVNYYVFVLFSASISSQFHVNKYPTLKLIRYGELVKKEYRGQRSADAIRSFVAEQLKDPVIKLEHSDEINAVEVSVGLCYLSCFMSYE